MKGLPLFMYPFPSIIILSELEGFKDAEIADILGIRIDYPTIISS